MARWLLVGEWLTPVGLRVGRRPGSKQSEWGSGCLLAGASVRAERQPGKRHPPDGAAESPLKKLREQLGAELEKFDTARVYTLESDKREGVLGDVRIPKVALRVLLALTSPVLVRNPIGPILSCLRRTVRERDSRWRRGRL
jgi:hypothetical protein